MREALRKKLPELMKKILADCLTTDIKGLENLENFRSKERIITVIKNKIYATNGVRTSVVT